MDYNSLNTSGTSTLPSLMYFSQSPSLQLPPPSISLPSISLSSPDTIPKKRKNKVHVSAACNNCKKAHLACDISRPCNRCVATDKADSCKDIQHKKRGRPKMMRDENNNKVKPTNTTPTNNIPSTKTTPNNIFIQSTTPSSVEDLFMIFLTMDLCCARVTDKSLEYVELYPQEFSHRSIYDFLLPDHKELLSKLHRYLLDNAIQYSTFKLPTDMIRSSSEKFFSTPIGQLTNIANGSLTLKQKLMFKSKSKEYELDCKFYLGSGFGSDILNSVDLNKLYIVCVVENAPHSRIKLPPLLKPDEVVVENVIYDDIDDHSSISSHSSHSNQSMSQNSNHSNDNSQKIATPLHVNTNKNNNDNNKDSEKKSMLDKFKYQTKSQLNQFIHPNELYYLKTTSSRLSSEAIAHTTFTYLSKSSSKNIMGSGPLAHYNNSLNK